MRNTLSYIPLYQRIGLKAEKQRAGFKFWVLSHNHKAMFWIAMGCFPAISKKRFLFCWVWSKITHTGLRSWPANLVSALPSWMTWISDPSSRIMTIMVRRVRQLTLMRWWLSVSHFTKCFRHGFIYIVSCVLTMYVKQYSVWFCSITALLKCSISTVRNNLLHSTLSNITYTVGFWGLLCIVAL